MAGDKNAIAAERQREAEANLFAMELLMPRDFLVADIQEMGGIDVDDRASIAKLAKRYKVSEHVMMLRIGQLAYE